MKRFFLTIACNGLLFIFSFTSHATLWDRGGGLIYDDVNDVTWMQDVNYVYTSGYWDTKPHPHKDLPWWYGSMTWDDAIDWAANLSYNDSVRNVTYDDWRLPTTLGTETGDIDEGEINSLFYDYGLSSSNPGPFISWMSGFFWTGTEFNNTTAWHNSDGYQNISGKDSYYFVWAVRDGDVAPVPEPMTVLLFGTGIAGLAGSRLRRKKKAIL